MGDRLKNLDLRVQYGRTMTLFLVVFLFYFILLFGQNVENDKQIFLSESTAPSSGSQREWIKVLKEIFPNDITGNNFTDAPSVFKSIEGINFDEDAVNTGYYHIPPDPFGAAGINHVVSVVNTSIEWFTKSGIKQNSESLHSFFISSLPLSAFDPKVIYDQYEDRFVVVVLDQTDTAVGDPTNTSRILIAVSSTSDPNGSWNFDEINSLINISGTDHWADYPGLAVDEEAIYVTTNMFTFGSGTFGGSRLWITNKNPLYSGGSAVVTVHDPPGEVGESATTMQPTHTFGTVPSSPTDVGTWLVRYSGYSNGTDESLSIIQVDDPLGTPVFTHEFVDLGNIDNTAAGMPDAPQSGSIRLIETNDRRALQAVWRNDELWICAQVVPPSGSDASQATAHWWQVNTTNLVGSLSLTDQGNVGGEDIATGAYTFFPAISVDKNGNMAIGFSASASSIYPGAYYTGRLSTDSPGSVQPSVVFAAGLDYYYRRFSGTRNRWGDYSGMSMDPVDDETFWVFNEYALYRGTVLGGYPGQDGRWGTRFANFKFGSQTVSPGDIIITEIMQNPSAVSDANGEWFEIYNPTPSAIDLNGWTIRDDGTDIHIIGGPLIIPINDFLVLGINDTSNVNGNYSTDYRYSGFVLGNGADEVILEDPDGVEIDRVNYDGGSNFPDPNGASMTVMNFQSNNNLGSNWIESSAREPTFTASGDFGSPGILGSDQALPVTLTSFTATAGDNKITLTWITESELNNIGFRVLRATDINGPYQMISSFEDNQELQGQFNSNFSHEYVYIDDMVINGITFWYRLVDVDVIGIETEQGPISATPQNGIGEIATIGSELPIVFDLHPNYPNPFNPETNILFDIPFVDNTKLTGVELTIYNGLGQKVKNLFQGRLSPGVHMVSWEGDLDNGQNAAGGTYFALLKAGRFQKGIKLILLK